MRILVVSFLMFYCHSLTGQEKINIGLHADPVIGWFGTDINAIKNSGARPGFTFGLVINTPFSPNYSFSTGINLTSAGGKLISKDTTILELSNPEVKLVAVKPDEVIIYNIQYLSVPIGIKLKTNQIGYLTFFSDVGLDPKVIVGGKVEIPSLDISGENAINELKRFNTGYHVKAGIEYGLGGSTAFIIGLGFENNFLDVTKDNGDQPVDKVTHRIISFRLGIIF